MSAAGLVVLLAAAAAQAKEPPVSFKEDVKPILDRYCVACHKPGGVGMAKTGLDLTSYATLMKGTQLGPMVQPGDPLTSNLVVMIEGRADKSIQMPHGKKKLNSCDRDTIRKWVQQGAKDN
jgi:mono/diheme cytochrome c family protein